MYRTIDLFAGAGGLSLGFQQTGEFEIVMAAENNPNARKTYERNHPGVEILSDVREIDYKKVREKYGNIDVVIGGPPCQGFSNANRQKAIVSMNNGLVKEYVRAIRELKPLVFVMENVSMLKSETHRFYCTPEDQGMIERLHITSRIDNLILVDAFAGLDEMIDEVEESLADYQNYLWDEKFFHAANVLYKRIKSLKKFDDSFETYKGQLKKYADRDDRCLPGGDIGERYQHLYECAARDYTEPSKSEELISALSVSVNLQKMYRKYKELVDNNIQILGFVRNKGIAAQVRSYSVFDYIKATLEAELFPYSVKGVTINAANYGAPQRRERFVILGSRIGDAPEMKEPLFTECDFRTVRQAIGDLEAITPSADQYADPISLEMVDTTDNPLLRRLRDATELENHFNTSTGKVAQERFDALKEGGNFHTLPDELKSTYSDGKRTQSTIYLKLKYDEPSGTVVNVRKSMWVHPALSRSLSVREAARLQTFPDSFVFEGTKDSQYQQVGNAVPPILAEAIADSLIQYLNEDHPVDLKDQILFEMALNPEATQAEIAERLGISQPSVSIYSRAMMDAGVLTREHLGGRKYRWRIHPIAR